MADAEDEQCDFEMSFTRKWSSTKRPPDLAYRFKAHFSVVGSVAGALAREAEAVG